MKLYLKINNIQFVDNQKINFLVVVGHYDQFLYSSVPFALAQKGAGRSIHCLWS